MIYRVRHETRYDYEDPVSVSHHILRLTPRSTVRQRRLDNWIIVTPRPSVTAEHEDYFSNKVTSFNLLEPHEVMVVEAISELVVHPPPSVDFANSLPWEQVRDSRDTEIEACQFAFDSRRAAASPPLADYAAESFIPGRPIFDAALDLTRRIYNDFRFDSKATEVSTPVETFFEKRRGVCQDFSHLQIACLRSLGLPARYVSGYLRTYPPAGRPRLVGADASHAWCSVWSPMSSPGLNPGGVWVDFDPTNHCVPSGGHITLAWGRDYSDVSPVYGVLLGGAEHTVDVAVDVMPLEETEDLTAEANA
jgi:transglutaminase-like putative cysteine protease